MVAKLPADFGSLESHSIIGELQAIDLALLVLHALYGYTVLVQFVEELVPATAVIVADRFHFLMNSL